MLVQRTLKECNCGLQVNVHWTQPRWLHHAQDRPNRRVSLKIPPRMINTPQVHHNLGPSPSQKDPRLFKLSPRSPRTGRRPPNRSQDLARSAQDLPSWSKELPSWAQDTSSWTLGLAHRRITEEKVSKEWSKLLEHLLHEHVAPNTDLIEHVVKTSFWGGEMQFKSEDHLSVRSPLLGTSARKHIPSHNIPK
jgi:hypothetical protein